MKRLYNNPNTKTFRRSLRHSQTDAESLIWRHLRNKQLSVKFFRQYSVGSYILDFYCPTLRLAVEIDGGQHNEEQGIRYDEARSQYLAEQNITVLRFWNNEVLTNIEGVMERIKDFITHPHPPLS